MSGKFPSVSIIVPAFNQEDTVIQTLDSALHSDVPDIELMVCDDASTDRTAAVIEDWATRNRQHFRRFVLLRHDLNRGLCYSLNDLVAEATGDILMVIAGDDYFLPGGIRAKAQAMVDHPEWGGAFCDVEAVGPEGQLFATSMMAETRFIPEQLTLEGMGEEILHHHGVPMGMLTWRRTIFKAHGGEFEYDTTVFCEDSDSVLWAAGKRILGYLPKVCQAYRCRSWPQTTNRNRIREYRDHAHVLAKHACRFPPHVRRGFYLAAAIHFNTAIGNTENIDLLWGQHIRDREEYLRRLADPENNPIPTVPPESETTMGVVFAYTETIEELKRQFHAQLERRKDKISEQKSHLKQGRKALKVLEKKLDDYASSPIKALRLWWRRFRKRKI